jgi:hypothetical protein
MFIRSLILIFIYSIGFSFNAIVWATKTNTESFQKSENIRELKALRFIYATLNINKDSYLNTLSNEDYEALRACYIRSSLDILSRQNQCEMVVKSVLDQAEHETTENGALLALVLCIELYAEKQNIKLYPKIKLYYSDTESFEKDFSLWFVESGSRIYPLNQDEAIFCWCTGAGAHNADYLIWYISKKDGNFSAEQLDIPTYNESSKAIESAKSILAQSVSFDVQQKKLVMMTSCGDVNGWEGKQYILDIQDNKLSLSKQRIVSNYEAYETSSIDNDTNWKIIYLAP